MLFMPNIPKADLDDRIDDLEEGTELSIVAIGDDEKTSKGYDKIVVTLKDGSEITGMGKAILDSLRAARDADDFVFGEDDPITCTVSKYESHGKTCTALN